MKKNSTVLMAALTLTAIILGVILLASGDRPVQASMLNAQDDFSLMSAGVVGNDEALVVIDKGSQKMIVYNLVNANNLNLIAWYDLGKGMAPAPGK